MTVSERRTIDHMAYLVPFNNELDPPYRVPKKLKEMISYIFSHPTLEVKRRKLFIDVSASGSRVLTNDMGRVAVAMCRHFVNNKAQYGHSLENIQFQIIIRMWRQVFNHMFKQSRIDEIDKYLGAKMMLLGIENGFWDELLRVVIEEDYYQTNDNMVKVREGVGLRERRKDKLHNPASLKEGTTHFEYLCSLE